MISSGRKYSLLAFFSCLMLGSILYFNSLDVPFYLDDYQNIVKNPFIRVTQLSIPDLTDAAFKSTLPGRPVANISFALNYYFHQEDVFGYHLVNGIIHILTGFLVYLLTVATLTTPALTKLYGTRRHLIALFASLLWLSSPLHTQSVTYIVQRMNSMAAMFFILSLWGYVRGRLASDAATRWIYYSGAVIGALLAFGSKEIAFTLPLVILLYEWYFFRDLSRKWLLSMSRYLLLCVVFLGVVVYLFPALQLDLLQGYASRTFTLPERVLTEFRVVVYYLSLLLFPYPDRLNLDHDFVVSTSLFTPFSTFLSLAFILGLLLFAGFSAQKYRLLSFAIIWYFINLFIESSFIGLEIIFEHRTYLPSVFLFIALSSLLFDRRCGPWFVVPAMVLLVSLCSFWTIQRNQTWKDPVVFWNDVIAKSPDKVRPYINLSVAYRENGDFESSIKSAQQAIRIDPGYINGFVNLGATYYEIGRYDEAIKMYRLVLNRKPDYFEIYNALGNAYLHKGMLDEAANAFRTNVQLDPSDYEPLANLASIKAYKGLVREAIADFKKAAELSGNKPDVLFNLGVAYSQAGEKQKAVEVYKELLRINPEDQQARRNLQQLQ